MREYKQELFAQKAPYLQWLKEQEAELERQYGEQFNQSALGKQIHTLPFSSCMDSVQSCGEFFADEVYLFVKKDGRLGVYAEVVFEEVFCNDADTVLAYADEDYRGCLGELYGIADNAFGEEVILPYRSMDHCSDSMSYAYYRGEPWFKPDFSPDTLASFFYIGSVFAIRGGSVLEVTGKYGSEISIYELVYRIFMDALDRKRHGEYVGIVHLSRVLYTNNSLADAERIDHSERIQTLYMADGQARSKTSNTASDRENNKISIVIPSRDNARILKRCLETLIRYTDYSNYEIIIVDNGSNLEQRECITHAIDTIQKEKRDLVVRYLYEKKEFNFSAMCNEGARSAVGEYLLFLNDDVEVMDTREGRHWLERMVAYAGKSHVGAVGAKLYYPLCTEENGCYRIQHVGITNMGIGPAHKLGGMADEGCLYHGHNTENYDMLAVTAACMLIRKSVFEEAGGFDETFPVAYNDVELCFRLYQRGYFNVQVNKAALIHHESLSRGQDISPEKQRRLDAERAKLYQKYPLLNARDPFYSPNLVQWKKDIKYNIGYLYDFDRQAVPELLDNDGESGKRRKTVLKKYDIRNFLYVKSRLAAKIYDKLTGYHTVMFHIDSVAVDGKMTDNGLTIEGWCAVKNMDNADLPRKLWLIYAAHSLAERIVYEFDIAPKLREDVAALLEGNDNSGTKNTALSGIQVNIGKNTLRPGIYCVGVLCRNKLVCDLEKYVNIPDCDTEDKEPEK